MRNMVQLNESSCDVDKQDRGDLKWLVANCKAAFNDEIQLT